MGLKLECKPRKKKRGKFSKWILISMLLFLLIFTSLSLYITYRTSTEPSTLITCVFAFCSVEGGYMAWIKKAKELNKNREDDELC